MKIRRRLSFASLQSVAVLALLAACRDGSTTTSTSTTGSVSSTGSMATSTSSTGSSTGGGGMSATSSGTGTQTSSSTTSSMGGMGPCGTPSECQAQAEQAASDHYDSITGDQAALSSFLTAMPKGGDLHNHLTGAVYAETYLDWAKQDGDCINGNTYAVGFSGQCGSNSQAVPTMGVPLYDTIVRTWSMKDFVAGAQSGHDHFFATFAKFGAVAGVHRNDDLADIAKRAATENQQYIETMFNVGKNIGDLSAMLAPSNLDENGLSALYDQIKASSSFPSALSSDTNVVTGAYANYRSALGCSASSPPAACDVGVRFIAQVSRTGAKATVFGQLISAFEMAAKTPYIVGANLSSPEDDSTSISNYNLHMKMIAFLRTKYTSTGDSPLHITLHAGELTTAFIPNGSNANTFHIHDAVEIAGAERIGHGIDILSETGSSALLSEMAAKGVLVEACMSSNAQILEVSGSAHPMKTYMQAGVPLALGTDDQGVSRSSLAGEFLRAAMDQGLTYRELKRFARDSLEHSFLPGTSLWIAIGNADPVSDCDPTSTMGLGDTPNAGCAAFLGGSEKATAQWELERRFAAFEKTFVQ